MWPRLSLVVVSTYLVFLQYAAMSRMERNPIFTDGGLRGFGEADLYRNTDTLDDLGFFNAPIDTTETMIQVFFKPFAPMFFIREYTTASVVDTPLQFSNQCHFLDQPAHHFQEPLILEDSPSGELKIEFFSNFSSANFGDRAVESL